MFYQKPNSNQKLSDLRKIAKNYGLTFKESGQYLGGHKAYALFDRTTGEQVSSIDTLSSWYDCQMHNQIISDYETADSIQNKIKEKGLGAIENLRDKIYKI